MHGFSGGLSANECKYLNERDHKFYMASQTMGGTVIFFCIFRAYFAEIKTVGQRKML